MITRVGLLVPAFFMLGMSATAFTQGVQTGTIRGTVTDQQDLAVPGVTVTATSPALQGERNTVTDRQGLYSLSALRAGTYRVQFELVPFVPLEHTVSVPLGLHVEQNVSMRPAGVTETIQVITNTPGPIATAVVGASFEHDEVESLANQRHLQGIAQLSPAMTENTPTRGS